MAVQGIEVAIYVHHVCNQSMFILRDFKAAKEEKGTMVQFL